MLKTIKEKIQNSVKIKKEAQQKEKIKKIYEDLKPKNDLNIKSINALDYAFKNTRVKNIAITGNYSSGKSSLIESYINKKLVFSKRNKVNTISLATFQSDKEDISVEELEKYIIEQLYYSTYRKNLKNNKTKSFLLAIFLYLLAISIISIIKMEWLETYFLLEHLKTTIALIFLILSFVIIWILKNILKYFYKIDKFGLQIMDLNIEIKSDVSCNIINENIELVLKIFKQFKYEYIIFEDLDRFNKTIIFEHLRELNNILNKNQNVKFFYLIKDDIFKEENRTKFFDYIYPVVPYVSYNTSGDELNKIIMKYSLDKELPNDFILNLTLFIQDMRILKNTLNEYRIYRIELNTEAVDYKKLFSILLYKNVFSEDFSNLQKLKGNLFYFLNKKKEKAEEIENQITEIKEKLEKDNINNFDKEFFCRAAERVITQKNANYRSKIVLENEKKGEKVLDGKVNLTFDFLTDQNTIIPYEYSQKNAMEFWKSEMPEWYKRINEINLNDQNEIEELQLKLQKLTKEMSTIKNANLKYLINNGIITDEEFNIFDEEIIKAENIRKTELVKYLLQEGYIDEEYSRYITRFHDGSLTKVDNDFLGNCIINRPNNSLEKLDNPDKIVDRLDENIFNNSSVLNINIFKSLVNAVGNGNKLNNFISTLLASETLENILDVFHRYLNEEECSKLYKYLGKNKSTFEVINNKLNNNKEKNIILKKLLLNSDIEDIKEFNNYDMLKSIIEEESIFLDDNNNLKIVSIIKELDIKYKNLFNGYQLNTDIFKYCINNNRYDINIDNIEIVVRYILDLKKVSIKDEMEKNYSIIKNNLQVFSYINENINKYLENIYFNIDNSNNDEEALIELLNNTRISNEYKEKIIEKEAYQEKSDYNKKYKIKDLSKIEEILLYNKILEKDLIEVSYKNIEVFFDNLINLNLDELTEEEKETKEENINIAKFILINFINRNAVLLKEDTCILEKTEDIFTWICLEESFENVAYEIIVLGLGRIIINMDITSLSNNKLNILVRNNIIKFNINMYNQIRKIGGDNFILFTYNNRTEILNNIEKYRYNSKEIVMIIRNKIFHWRFKEKVIKNLVNYKEYNFIPENASKIMNYIINKNYILDFSTEQILNLIHCSNSNYIKLKFLNLYFKFLDKDSIESILEIDLKKYLPLILNKKKPTYDYNVNIINLIENLKEIGYNIKCTVKNNIIQISPTNRQ